MDLQDIWRRGAKLFSAAMADTHLRDIRAAATRLTEFPLSGPARDSLFPGVRSLLIHPSVIFYRIAGADIEIVRVVDGRRNLAAIFRDEPGG
jgi:toxin ParE1/3/4